jgi:hypothetical protein
MPGVGDQRRGVDPPADHQLVRATTWLPMMPSTAPAIPAPT